MLTAAVSSRQVAVARLRRLPVLHDFPVDAVPRSPYPNDSELYCAIRCLLASPNGRPARSRPHPGPQCCRYLDILGINRVNGCGRCTLQLVTIPHAYELKKHFVDVAAKRAQRRTPYCDLDVKTILDVHSVVHWDFTFHAALTLFGRRRVRQEVFRGQDANGAHRSGSEGAAAAILGYAAAAYAAYAAAPSIATGFALGALACVRSLL